MYSGLFSYVSFCVVIGIEVIAGYSLWSQSQWGAFIHRGLTPAKNCIPPPPDLQSSGKLKPSWQGQRYPKEGHLLAPTFDYQSLKTMNSKEMEFPQ